MARRSPTNPRYQKYQEPPGKTRKSAAAAKPSRKATGTTAGATKAKTPPGRGRARLDPQTPEFKALRKRWWMLLLAGVALVTVSWGVRYIERLGGVFAAVGRLPIGSSAMTWAGLLASLTLGLAYACIFYALYLDFAKMRPMRLAASKGAQPADKPAKPASRSDKPAAQSTHSTSEGSSND